jgi:hypothetical protein
MNGTRAFSDESIAPAARRPGGASLASCLLLAVLSGVTIGLTACARSDKAVEYSRPDAAVGQLMLPAKIQIQRYWTRPISLSGKPGPDAMEVIVAAFDSCGDNTKMAGTLHIELFTRRAASSDKLGQRLAFWAVELNSIEQMTEHWDSLARFYRFPLKLPAPPLRPGRYVLTATLQPPCGDRLMDEYDFEYEAGKVAQKSPSHKGGSSKHEAGSKGTRQRVEGSLR